MSHRTLASGIIGPGSLRWVSVHELTPPRVGEIRANPEAALALHYVQDCYILPGFFMTPETNHGCGLCKGAPRYSPDPAVTDGIWWFAFAVAHYLRVHGYSLPDSVLSDLRSREFAVPRLEHT